MRSSLASLFQWIICLLLVLAVLGITTATLLPVIYRSEWYQKQYPTPTPEER